MPAVLGFALPAFPSTEENLRCESTTSAASVRAAARGSTMTNRSS